MNQTEIIVEGVLKVIQNGELIAVIHNDMKKKSQVLYTCKEMGAEEVKSLLESVSLNGNI